MDNNNSFTLQHDETVSESLLEKFNNLSCDINDRILKRVIVIKEQSHVKNQEKFQSPNTVMTNLKNSLLSHSQECIANNSHKLRLAPTTVLGGGGTRTPNRGQSSPRPMMLLKNVCESINARGGGGGGGRGDDRILKCERVNDGYTLGISIVQGTDNNVYVKDMVPNGPGDKSGIMIGDQVSTNNKLS
jgi:tyrosine-protein phosphatase non-receptor type 13